MSSTKSRKAKHQKDVTAQPKSDIEEIRPRAVPEVGLSVDPDELGQHFLVDATEQGNFESLDGGQELSIVDGPVDDSPHRADGSVWEQTVDQELESGELDGPAPIPHLKKQPKKK